VCPLEVAHYDGIDALIQRFDPGDRVFQQLYCGNFPVRQHRDQLPCTAIIQGAVCSPVGRLSGLVGRKCESG
jgi:hypothetical protein